MPNKDVRHTEGLPPADPAKTPRGEKIDLRVTAEQRNRWTEYCLTSGWELPEWMRRTLDLEAQETASVRMRRHTLAVNADCALIRLQELLGHGQGHLKSEVQKVRNYLDEIEELAR